MSKSHFPSTVLAGVVTVRMTSDQVVFFRVERQERTTLIEETIQGLPFAFNKITWESA